VNNLDTMRPPWVSSPYSLHSWWDMERFSAATFMQLVNGLSYLADKIENLPPEMDASELAVKYIPIVQSVCEGCAKIGLTTSQAAGGYFVSLADTMSAGELSRSLKELENTIRFEMQGCHFFHMDGKLVPFYNQNSLFGMRVTVRFPEMQYDITEAGNCYAMGRSTACVFHLMRIMEIGVQKFGDRLGIQFTNSKDWHNIVEEINKAIKPLPQKKAETVALSQAAAHLYNVKVAWRNRVMHPHDVYTLEEAGALLEHVKSFINNLANLLYMRKSGKEPPVM
jgi:hypothetical protein